MINSIFNKAKQITYVCFAIIMLHITLWAQSAFAEDVCDDLWYSRNFHFDQAGYCFGSKLGKSVFDNANCKSKNVNLSKMLNHRINLMKKIETEWECKINTSQIRVLNIPHFNLRKNLDLQPISQGFESSCFGYTSEQQVPLYAAMSENSKILGYVRLGDDVIDAHEEVIDSTWWFATSISKAGHTIIGWTNAIIFGQCEAMAG